MFLEQITYRGFNYIHNYLYLCDFSYRSASFEWICLLTLLQCIMVTAICPSNLAKRKYLRRQDNYATHPFVLSWHQELVCDGVKII